MFEQQTGRYARQLVLPEIGPDGQQKLQSARVLIIGTGGLGSPAALYMAAAGVGTIGLADGDPVELSNLQRQILHSTETLGINKAESAASGLIWLNPEICVQTYPLFVTSENAAEMLADYDFILECTDSMESKSLINDVCVREGKPFCFGAAVRFYGQLMTVIPGQGPCYRCAFGDLQDQDKTADAKKLGVIGAVPGVIGCLQAMEAIKYVTGVGELLTGRLLTCDALQAEFQTIPLLRDPECPVCGAKKEQASP